MPSLFFKSSVPNPNYVEPTPKPLRSVAKSPYNQMVFGVTINPKSKDSFSLEALVSSATAANFISSKVVKEHNLEVFESKDITTYSAAIASVELTSHSFVRVTMLLNGTDHEEVIELKIVESLIYPILLGGGWLKKHGPLMDVANFSLIFDRCLQGPCKPRD